MSDDVIEMVGALSVDDLKRLERMHDDLDAIACALEMGGPELRRVVHYWLLDDYCPHCFGPAKSGGRLCQCENDE